MITKTTYYTKMEDDQEVHVIEFPELSSVNINDPEIQKEAIKWGVAVGIPGGDIIFKKNARFVATGGAE